MAQQRLPGFVEGITRPNGRLAAGRLEHVVKLICLGRGTAFGRVDPVAKRTLDKAILFILRLSWK